MSADRKVDALDGNAAAARVAYARHLHRMETRQGQPFVSLGEWLWMAVVGFGVYPFRLLWWFGALVLAATLIYVRSFFALGFGLLTGAAMIAAAWYLHRNVSDLALRVIGLTSMIYVPYDIFSDTIARSHLDSDARILATEIGGPTLFWGALWLILSLAAIAWCLRRGLGPDSNLRRQST